MEDEDICDTIDRALSVESKQITASIETNILREMQFNGSIDFQDG